MVVIEQDPHARFEKAIFNLLLSFNYIEQNLGYLIASIPGLGERDALLKQLSNKPFEKKMKWFQKLLGEEPLRGHLGEMGILEFESWFSEAHEARALRNRYGHAIWRFYPMRRGSPVSISSPEWMRGIIGPDLEEALSLDELEAKARSVEKVFKRFSKLRKKYRV